MVKSVHICVLESPMGSGLKKPFTRSCASLAHRISQDPKVHSWVNRGPHMGGPYVGKYSHKGAQ